MYEDNDARIKVADSSAHKRQMRHIAIRDFTLQDWTDRDIVTVGKSFLRDTRISFHAEHLLSHTDKSQGGC
jgi:hypothetical protein